MIYNLRFDGLLGREAFHVIGVHFEGFFPGDSEGFLFDEGVFDVLCFGGLGEDGVVVDGALAEFCDFGFGVTGFVIRGKQEIFDVEHGDPVGMVLHDVYRADAGDHGPSTVEFQGDYLGASQLK